MNNSRTTDSTQALKEGSIGILLLKYALPAIAGTVINALYNIIDRIFIGQGVGPYAISGLALTLPIIILLQAFGMLIGVGAASRISISLGQKDKKYAEKILCNALLLTFIITSFCIILSLVFLEPILYLFGGSEATLPYAKEYLIYIIPGNILAALSFGFNNMMRASGYPFKAMFTMLIGAAINILLTPLFIFTLNMGIKGAAIATDISWGITTLWVMWHFLSKESTIRLKKKFIRLNLNVIVSILSIGLSPFLMQVTAAGIHVFINISLERYGGDLALGAFGIINSLALLLLMVVIGLNQGMQPIVGYNYGAGDYKRVVKTLKYTIYGATVVTLLGTQMAFLVPQIIVKAFTQHTELIEISANGLRISLCMFFTVGFQAVATNFFQSIGMVFESIFLSLTRQFLFLFPALVILPSFYGLNGVWAASPVADTFAAVVTFFFLIYQIKLFKKEM